MDWERAILKGSQVYVSWRPTGPGNISFDRVSPGPDAKLNIIRDYSVVEKKVVEIPDEIIGIVKCVNPQCITNHEKISTRFYVIDKKEIKLRCHYCEKLTDKEHMTIL